MNWLKRNPCDLIKYTLVGIHDAVRSNNLCHHGDCTTRVLVCCSNPTGPMTPRKEPVATRGKAVSALRRLCPPCGARARRRRGRIWNLLAHAAHCSTSVCRRWAQSEGFSSWSQFNLSEHIGHELSALNRLCGEGRAE